VNAIRLEDSEVAPSENGGYTLASCEQYWIILGVFAETPRFLFEWTGDGWSDLLSDALLFDRAGAEAAVQSLGEFPGRTVRSVNFADYLRYDRRMAGHPRHQAGTPRHRGSSEALSDIYRQILGGR
jgi:hypothetical protein